jgi:hypothetical protein
LQQITQDASSIIPAACKINAECQLPLSLVLVLHDIGGAPRLMIAVPSRIAILVDSDDPVQTNAFQVRA